MKSRLLNNKNHFTVIDLFCGAGGFSEGFRQAGYSIVSGIDNNNFALETFSRNFTVTIAINEDLSSSINGSLNYYSLPKKVDVIIGGPPCQGFSIAGKRISDDPRNKLYRVYIDLIEKFDPSAVVMENVPAILSLFGGEIAKQIKEDFEDLGFKTQVFTLLASDYGVPQNRKRTFFVGVKSNKLFKIPAPTTPFTPITTEMAISDLPLLEDSQGAAEMEYIVAPQNDYQRQIRENSAILFNHWAVIHQSKTVEIIKLVPDGGNYKDLPENLQDTRKVNIAWTRMNSKRPCFTIDAGHNHHFHYSANRVPTVRECARIQSFPDKFRFWGIKTSQFRQVGNAVPPLLAKEIALELKKIL